ncbi:helix-turn-helix domain-containing protein [Tenacibaculum insulae]|uniref:helix-turn-helix domain-containing protein n=1 Tax=Tenacibaculum insulae TaxID=2029677 RepID=UPI003AB1657B
MEYNFYNEKDARGLINNFFSISIANLPFESTIIPIGFPSITYAYGKEQVITHKKNITKFKELIVTGQFNSSYHYFVNSTVHNIGANLHPTALYKILGTDISLITNQHLQVENINKKLFNEFSSIFLEYENDIVKLIKAIIKHTNNLNLFIDKDVNFIDTAIDYILEKEGMIQVLDLLTVVPLSQKSLETKFKKIIGLTPGKYIRLIRFIKLMRKYEGKEIDINDLIYMYNYYDHSHFIKDFKLFMAESPKEYFKKEYPLIKAYSKKL